RPASEDVAALGLVSKLDPLGRSGEDHLMLADDAPPAQRREADGALRPGSRVTVARAHRMPAEIDAAAVRRRLAEQECGSRRRVDLVLVMHFENFNIEFIAERRRDLLDQRGEEIDAETHVAGL